MIENIISMRRRRLTAFIAVFFMMITVALTQNTDQQDPIKKISQTLKQGNASELATLFNPTVEMEILGEENVYSKAQAELLLKDFFTKNKPTSFKVNHQGTKGSTSFAIGILVTSTENYRISVFLKSENDKMLIHQIRIEVSDDKL